MSRRRAIAGLLLALLPAPVLAAQDDAAGPTRAFSFPLTREARTRAEVAEDHVRAERWTQAVLALQEILEENELEVLPSEYHQNAHLVSVHPAHPGAAQWARDRLLALPAEARTLYRERFEPIAADALREARRTGTRRALVRVAQRWPLTAASHGAWLTLGDLELEQGHPLQALIAWRLAGELAERDAPPPGTSSLLAARERRSALALGMLRSEGTRLTVEDVLRPADPTRRRGPLPSREADPWTHGLDLTPFGSPYEPVLHPTLASDRLLASSGLRLYCIDAFTGERRWQAGPPEGWVRLGRDANQLFQGINRDQAIMQPAAGGRVAVAALQLPYSVLPNEVYQNIEVMKAIPQRRLYAYDLETGEELWNHAPRLEWDTAADAWRARGPFDYAQRMLVAGPPLIHGARLLVPCYTLEGRIEFQVACYELATGELLWSTSVVSGQRSRNMFGRAMEEFAASPVVVAGDRVVVQTELGTIAALDLMTGRILWESLYRQIALPQTSGYHRSPRRRTWRLTSPSVVEDSQPENGRGGVVVCTPSDSDEITGFDLEDGRVLWSYAADRLYDLTGEDDLGGFDLLLGADRSTVYLAGTRVAALRKPGGLASTGRFNLVWVSDRIGEGRGSRNRHRPLLCAEHVLVPLNGGRIVLGRTDGRERRSLSGPWEGGYAGNPLVEGGLLYTLGERGMNAFFDWELLVQRQRKHLAANPGDTEVALTTAVLFTRRAQSALEDGDALACLNFVRSARGLLEPLLSEPSPVRGDGANADRAELEGALHRSLRTEARALEGQGLRDEALATLERARALAPTRVALRDTLLQEERNLRGAARLARHLEVLALLEERCDDLPLSPEAGATAAFPSPGRPAPSSPDTPFDPRIGPLADATALEPTIGLWVLCTRAEALADAGELARAFEDWHAVIERFDDVELEPQRRAGDLARDEISAKLARPAGLEAYARFEERAEALYAEAERQGTPQALEELIRRYPHAQATRRALDAKLQWSFEAGDAEEVARIVYGTERAPDSAADREAFQLLAHALGRAGNRTFERALIERLAREHPSTPSALEAHDGAELEAVAAGLAREGALHDTVLPRFDEHRFASSVRTGRYEYVGRLVPPLAAEAAPEEMHVYLVRHPTRRSGSQDIARLEAFSNTSRERPLWGAYLQEPVGGPNTCAIADGRILLGSDESLVALDADGRHLWRRAIDDGPVMGLEVHQGVAVVVVGGQSLTGVHAFDAWSGVPLWSHDLRVTRPDNGTRVRRLGWRRPVLGEGYCALFLAPFGDATRVRVLDVHRGRTQTEINLGMIVGEGRVEQGAWLAAGRLLVPHFSPSAGGPARLMAYDLPSGNAAWRRPLPDSELFRHVVEHAGAYYLVTVSDSPGQTGGVYALDLERGNVRRLVALRVGEVPMGLLPGALTRLASDDLLTYRPPTSSQPMTVRSMRLDEPHRWDRSIRVPGGLDRARILPLPAVAEGTIAMAYQQRRSNGLAGTAYLTFLDRTTGDLRETRMLHEDFAHAELMELRGLGDALFLIGTGARSQGWILQILENRDD